MWAPHGGRLSEIQRQRGMGYDCFLGERGVGPTTSGAHLFHPAFGRGEGPKPLFFGVFGTQESNHVHAAYGLRMVLVRGLDMGHGAIGYCVRAHFSFLSPLAHPRMHPPGMGSSCLVRSGRWKALKY